LQHHGGRLNSDVLYKPSMCLAHGRMTKQHQRSRQWEWNCRSWWNWNHYMFQPTASHPWG